MDTTLVLNPLLCLVALVLLSPLKTLTEQASAGMDFTVKNEGVVSRVGSTGIIGAVVDCSTRVGKEEIVAMEMAFEDLYNTKNQRLILRVKCSRGDPVQAAQAARHLMNKNHVQAILGLNSWEESSAVAKVAEQFDIPILSFSDSAPLWATERWPFFIQASPSTSKQMEAVAAIVQSWGWRRINVIYEETDSAASGILTNLNGALQEVDVEISSIVSLPSFASLQTVHDELEKLKKGQCRVFLVHANLDLAARLFGKAKEMKMLERNYVWITTDSIASLVNSMNASFVSSIQGVVGVRRYFSETRHEFHNFYARFVDIFRKKYAEEKNHEPGIFSLLAYDVAWTLLSAINAAADGNSDRQILERIQETDFLGLSGKIQLNERRLAPINQFQIINVFGKSYRELGYWTHKLGFSTVVDNTTAYDVSMTSLGHVLWPGGPWSTPRGWDLPTISNPMKIGVPNGSLTNRFVKVEYDPFTNNYTFSGFSLEVFNKTVQHLNYYLPYQFIAFNGSYTDLVKQVQLKEFDAVVGDIAIISSRYNYVEFTHAHTESGVVMVVPIQRHSSRTWLFMKPFTRAMWLLTAFVNVYNGFVIWSIERNYYSELRGESILNQIGTLIWLAFATLFSLHGEKLHSNLSRMATIVWLFVALIITQSYTACLTSMLTVQHLDPKVANIETLKNENAFVGYSRRSFVRGYLEEALHFNPKNIKNFTTTDGYAQALRNGEIEAAFLEVPVAKLFVAKYCKSFTIAGPTYKVGGYGFAFPKGSPFLPDIDEALLKVFETGALRDLENSLIASEKCVDIQPDNDTASLSPQSFFVLFIFTGGTSTAALAICYFRRKWTIVVTMAGHERIWMLILMVLYKWRAHWRRFSRKVSDAESPRNSPNSIPPWT